MANDSKPLELVLLKAAEVMIDRAIDTHLENAKTSMLHCRDVERLLAVLHHLKAISIRVEVAVDG
jgi:hypothetical protein